MFVISLPITITVKDMLTERKRERFVLRFTGEIVDNCEFGNYNLIEETKRRRDGRDRS